MQRAPVILKTFGFPEEKVIPVLECIRTHQPAFTPETLEATLLRDADILEQLGAVGILRTVCKIGRDTRFHTFTDAVSSLLSAFETLPSKLILKQSQALAQDRIDLHRAFLQATAREAGHLLL